ncbi:MULTISPECIES: N4-gp56 family major capsid protein [unclassified Pseudomonas]|uniref:N4-gp56 family major capsid protein n=1 Tax=unclassified Pseudomonas TaxID=196821 RepID=UPI00131BD518|nr:MULTISPECIES: N4-gp56 family major capsid protein [unclassified Pseudomonas]
MAATNFAALAGKAKVVWSRELWIAARNQLTLNKFLGKGQSAMIQRITELTKTEKGEKVIMQLVADLTGDGVIGDNEREGFEESMQSYSIEIQIDQISHGVINKGKLADQKTVINFREQARDKLSYWLASRIDELMMLTLSGISYSYTLDGARRDSKSAFPQLSFAADVRAPTAKRHRVWNGSELVAPDTSIITKDCTLSYSMLVDAGVYAKDHYITPLRVGGKEYYIVLLKPGALGQLKKDQDFLRAITGVAAKEGQNSPFFTGGTVTVDGLVLHELRTVYSTKKAAADQKWGADGNVDGTRTLICGAQALGFADLGAPEWDEKKFNYSSRQGINIDKLFGLLKPQFYSNYDESVEDFGVLAIDHYLG